jgi:kinesin family protein 2/24
MGNGESNPVRNMDKRTARREYKDNFCSGIAIFRKNQEHESDAEKNLEWEDGAIRVCVRKRPIFKDEINGFEFDVASCFQGNSIIIHDCRMHADMKRQFINHHKFQFDRVFNEQCDNNLVYAGNI